VPLEAAVNLDAVAGYQEREAKRQKLKEAAAVAYIGAAPDAGDGGFAGSAGAASSGGDVVAAAPEAPIVPLVPFAACLERWAAPEVVEGYESAAAGGARTTANKTVRFSTFPPYLVMQMARRASRVCWPPASPPALCTAAPPRCCCSVALSLPPPSAALHGQCRSPQTLPRLDNPSSQNKTLAIKSAGTTRTRATGA
jgi:hypothetical protein